MGVLGAGAWAFPRREFTVATRALRGLMSIMASPEVLSRMEQRAIQAEQMIELLTKQVW